MKIASRLLGHWVRRLCNITCRLDPHWAFPSSSASKTSRLGSALLASFPLTT